jgi:hypothetical protein
MALERTLSIIKPDAVAKKKRPTCQRQPWDIVNHFNAYLSVLKE